MFWYPRRFRRVLEIRPMSGLRSLIALEVNLHQVPISLDRGSSLSTNFPVFPPQARYVAIAHPPQDKSIG
jgi:hypothetical protein